MDALSRIRTRAGRAATVWLTHLLVHLGWFAVAAVFVGVLLLTYGLDLSVGLF